MAELTISTVESMRSGEKFQILYETTLTKATIWLFWWASATTQKEEAKLFHNSAQHRYQEHVNPYYSSPTVELYRQTYYEIIDLFLTTIKERFRNPTFKIYAALEKIFVNFINNGTEWEEGMKILKKRYEEDSDVDAFLVELSLVKQLAKSDKINNLENIKKLLVHFPKDRNLLQNLLRVHMMLADNPTTSATIERLFFLARRIKTWHRNTTGVLGVYNSCHLVRVLGIKIMTS